MNTPSSKTHQATIVVIDDDFGIRESVKDMLALENWDCVMAESGKEGLELIKALKPELVVVDLQLPDMSGFHLCKRIKRDPAMRETPIVIITGRFTELQDKIQGFEFGADEYFYKPFEPAFFISKIRSILRGLATKAA